MKGHLVALDHVNGFEAAVQVIDGRIDDLLIDTDRPRPGTIYRAISDRPVKGQGGMFLRTPDGSAFLRKIKGLSPGQPILVQITGYPEPGKALPVTSRILFKSRYAIITPTAPGVNISRSIKNDDTRDALLEIAHGEIAGDQVGLILRSSCDGAEHTEIAEDIRAMLDLSHAVMGDAEGSEPEKLTDGDGPHTLAWREWTAPSRIDPEPGSFDRHGVLDQIEDLRRPAVALTHGASMFIEPTRALIAIDINTGNDTSPAAGLKANLSAVKELPRQLRLRGLGGQITLDLAPMAKKDRRQFETALRSAFRADLVETALVGWTPLGHFELQRKRDRIALNEALK